METQTPTIYGKIAQIMREIEPIAKGKKNAQQGYSYRGVDDVMNGLSGIMAKHGVFPKTDSIENISMDKIVSKSGTEGYHVTALYTFKLVAEDGSFTAGVAIGEASDYGDKACGKAHSYAYRDFLMKTFVIPTEGDHDTDASSPESVAKPQEKKPQEKQKTKATIQQDQTDRIKAIAKAIHTKTHTWAMIKGSYDISPEVEVLILGEVQSLEGAQ